MSWRPIGQIQAQAPPANQALVISQVRGTECCEAGNLEKLQFQVELFKQYQIPAFLTLRYDVLTNPDMVNYLKTELGEGRQLGLFLEITPNLAQKAGINYTGDEQTWYQAQHAYTIGLLPLDRQKVIDTLFQTFFDQFGYYPQLTTAWIIDTPTLNYLHEKYGVITHQITREQWGTDSYTLWGGPEHYPYPASAAWAFIPDYDRADAPLIVRQTVSDPLLNYGDQSSSFTSQPNDYSRDGKKFDYFQQLINQAVSQPAGQPGFILLGLETSMDQPYQVEFAQQIAFLAQLTHEGKISWPSLAELNTFWTQSVSLYTGSDLVKKTNNNSYIINSPHYKIRLRQNSNQVFIDDLRIYDTEFTDPYTDYQAKNAAHWIVPNLVDGGRWYKRSQKKPILHRWFDPPDLTTSIFYPPSQDLASEPSRIELPNLADQQTVHLAANREKSEITLIYQSNTQGEIAVTFQPNQILISPASVQPQLISYQPDLVSLPDSLSPTQNLLSFPGQSGWTRPSILTTLPLANLHWPSDQQALLTSQYSCDSNVCTWSFASQPSWLTELRASQYPLLFPERQVRKVSAVTSKIFAHNRYALANQNPVRLVIAPFDQLGFPTLLATSPTISTWPAVDRISQPTTSPNHVATYFDLHQTQPQKIDVTIELPDGITKKTTVYFAPDCRAQLSYCLTHPRQSWWFVRFKIWDFIRNRLEN